MSNKKYWLKSGIITLVQNGFTVLFGFLSFVFLVRVVSKEAYGTWVLFLSVVSIVELLRNGFTQDAIVKFLSSSNSETDRGKIVTATFVINTAMTTAISVCILFTGQLFAKLWNAPEINTMLHLYIIVFFFSGILNQINCIEQSKLRFTGIFYSNIARQAIFFGFVMYCYFFQKPADLITLTYVQIAGCIVAVIIGMGYTFKSIEFSRTVDNYWIKKILNFGKYTFGISIGTVLSSSIDQMMLGSMLSKSITGSFNIAVRMTNLAEIPIAAMGSIVYPQISRVSMEDPTSVRYLYEKSTGVVLAILLPALIFMYIFATPLIHMIAGHKYDDVIPLLRVTLLTCLFAPYGRQCGIILNGTGKTKFNLYLVIITAILIIVTNLILIPRFGAIGAAYATLLATAISFVISQVYMYKLYGIKVQNPWIYAFKFYPEFYHKYISKRIQNNDDR